MTLHSTDFPDPVIQYDNYKLLRRLLEKKLVKKSVIADKIANYFLLKIQSAIELTDEEFMIFCRFEAIRDFFSVKYDHALGLKLTPRIIELLMAAEQYEIVLKCFDALENAPNLLQLFEQEVKKQPKEKIEKLFAQEDGYMITMMNRSLKKLCFEECYDVAIFGEKFENYALRSITLSQCGFKDFYKSFNAILKEFRLAFKMSYMDYGKEGKEIELALKFAKFSMQNNYSSQEKLQLLGSSAIDLMCWATEVPTDVLNIIFAYMIQPSQINFGFKFIKQPICNIVLNKQDFYREFVKIENDTTQKPIIRVLNGMMCFMKYYTEVVDSTAESTPLKS